MIMMKICNNDEVRPVSQTKLSTLKKCLLFAREERKSALNIDAKENWYIILQVNHWREYVYGNKSMKEETSNQTGSPMKKNATGLTELRRLEFGPWHTTEGNGI